MITKKKGRRFFSDICSVVAKASSVKEEKNGYKVHKSQNRILENVAI